MGGLGPWVIRSPAETASSSLVESSRVANSTFVGSVIRFTPDGAGSSRDRSQHVSCIDAAVVMAVT
jgi:hypothetical protein